MQRIDINEVPQEYRDIISELEQVDKQLRTTDIRLEQQATEEKIKEFVSLLDKGSSIIEKLSTEDASYDLSGNMHISIFISNFKGLLHVQTATCRHVWHKELRKFGVM